MWCTIVKSYAGPAGMFAKGHKLDLPESTITQLPKGTCRPCPSPWAPQKPKTAKPPKDKQLHREKKKDRQK